MKIHSFMGTLIYAIFLLGDEEWQLSCMGNIMFNTVLLELEFHCNIECYCTHVERINHSNFKFLWFTCSDGRNLPDPVINILFAVMKHPPSCSSDRILFPLCCVPFFPYNFFLPKKLVHCLHNIVCYARFLHWDHRILQHLEVHTEKFDEMPTISWIMHRQISHTGIMNKSLVSNECLVQTKMKWKAFYYIA